MIRSHSLEQPELEFPARVRVTGWLETLLFLIVAAAVTLGGEWFQRARRELSGCETHLRLILNTVPGP